MLGRLGSGGMGEVNLGFDPELDRKVAIKVLRADRSRGTDGDNQERLLKEARAMARLDHPNVVAVHDVGVHLGRVFVAMDLVEGETLAAWRQRTNARWREVVDVFIAAGRGLAAAHRRHLVHRDFKPDNVMIDAGGRVRVMDFGLARPHGETSISATKPLVLVESGAAAGTLGDSLVGTPAYMAPELLAGVGAGTKADQYAFCVSLWETLYGQRPYAGDSLAELVTNVIDNVRQPPPSTARLPRWLRNLCERGLDHDPERRFESMDALVAALRRGHAASRRRTATLGLAVIAAAAAGLEGARRLDRAGRVEACEAQGRSIAEVWNPERQRALHQSLVSTGVRHAETTSDKVMGWLDAHADDWAAARTSACLRADVEGTWAADLYERSRWCLLRRRVEMDTLVAALVQGEGRVADRAVSAAASLPGIDSCLNTDVLSRLPSPPTRGRERITAIHGDLARATARLMTGAYAEGLALARNATAEAADLDSPPLSASARLLTGRLLARTGEYESAEHELEEAFFIATDAGSDELALDAADALTYVVGARLERHRDGRRWSRLAKATRSAVPDPLGLHRAQSLQDRAAVEMSAGEYDEARAALEQAKAIREKALGPEHPSVATTAADLGNALRRLGRYDASTRLHERALAIREQALGREHPDVGQSLASLGNAHFERAEHDEAAAKYRAGLGILERALGAEHPNVARVSLNLAHAERARRNYPVAREIYERVLERQEEAEPDSAFTGYVLGDLADLVRVMGDPEQAKSLSERALAIKEAALGPDHPDVATMLDNSGVLYLDTGDHAEARSRFERALRIREASLGPEHPDAALSQINLGLVDASAGEHEHALARQQRALEIRRAALASDHPLLAEAHVNVASGLTYLRRYEEARVEYEHALEIQERRFGGDSPRLVQVLLGLANAHERLDRSAEAVTIAERALAPALRPRPPAPSRQGSVRTRPLPVGCRDRAPRPRGRPTRGGRARRRRAQASRADRALADRTRLALTSDRRVCPSQCRDRSALLDLAEPASEPGALAARYGNAFCTSKWPATRGDSATMVCIWMKYDGAPLPGVWPPTIPISLPFLSKTPPPDEPGFTLNQS